MVRIDPETLRFLGLNKLEAEVYCFLLKSPSRTAYQIAKALGKPSANVYKVVDSLGRKGAAVASGGTGRKCRAIPVREFLGHVETDFKSRLQQAEEVLSSLKGDPHDETVYHIESPHLVMERALKMIARCRMIVVVDAFPEPLHRIAPALARVAAREIDVYLQAYRPIAIKGVNVVVAPGAEEVLRHWSCQQLNIVVDAAEHLLTIMNQDLSAVHQAIWSQSLYLSSIVHAGLMREHTLHRLRKAAPRSGALKEMKKILSETHFFHEEMVPGQVALMSRYHAEPADRRKDGDE